MGAFGILPFGGSAAKTDRKYERLGLDDLSNLFNQTTRFGVATEKTGQAGVSDALDYFHKLLTGDRATVGETLAPAIDTIKNQDYNRRLTDQQFGTRSGGNNSQELSLESNVSDQVTKLLAGIFGEAGKAEGSLGLGETGLGLESLNIGGNAASNLVGGATAIRKQDLANSAGQIQAILGALSYAGVV